MRKIKMQNLNDLRVNEAFEKYVISKKAQGVKDVMIKDYHYHFRSMSKSVSLLRTFGRSHKMLERVLSRKERSIWKKNL